MDLGPFVIFNKYMIFIRRLKREIFYFSCQRFQIWWLISQWKTKFQLNICKIMPARQHRVWVVNTIMVNNYLKIMKI